MDLPLLRPSVPLLLLPARCSRLARRLPERLDLRLPVLRPPLLPVVPRQTLVPPPADLLELLPAFRGLLCLPPAAR